MTKQKVVGVFGFEGVGATVTEAKRNATNKIIDLHTDSFEPEIVTWQGESVLVYRSLLGWEIKFIQHRGGELGVPVGCWMTAGNRAEAIEQARRHIAQAGWQFTDPIDHFPSFVTSESYRRELISQRKWQLRVTDLVKRGYSLERARDIADGRDMEDVAA